MSYIALGSLHSACITEQGGVFTWGCGELGCLGHDFTGVSERTVTRPRLLDPVIGLGVFSIAAGPFTVSVCVCV